MTSLDLFARAASARFPASPEKLLPKLPAAVPTANRSVAPMTLQIEGPSKRAKRKGPMGGLPDFLQVTVQKGIIDELTAKRIELHRRTRGYGMQGEFSSLVTSIPDPDLTFDNFIQCNGNAFALELARNIAARAPAALPYNPLYIYADVGLGKTHLLSALANGAHNCTALLVNTADLDAEFERAQRLNSRAELRQWLFSADILLVDDIQLCEGRDMLQREVFSILNHIIRAKRSVVISSDVPPTKLEGIESRLLSRLGAGVIVGLQMGNERERKQLLRHFLQDRSMSMSDDVVDYLAHNVANNVRQLKAAVSQLLMMSQLGKQALTLDMARSVAGSGGYEMITRDLEPDVVDPMSMEEPPSTARPVDLTRRFKEMLATAESKEEQALALQIALGERIRQLKNEGGAGENLARFEKALEVLREGDIDYAVKLITG